MTLNVVRHEVYRLYDKAEELLYVGYSGNIQERLRRHSHRNAQPWWPDVAWCSLEEFRSQTDALAAEVAAIKTERPRYNRRSVVGS